MQPTQVTYKALQCTLLPNELCCSHRASRVVHAQLQSGVWRHSSSSPLPITVYRGAHGQPQYTTLGSSISLGYPSNFIIPLGQQVSHIAPGGHNYYTPADTITGAPPSCRMYIFYGVALSSSIMC